MASIESRGYNQEKLTRLVSLNINHQHKNLPKWEVKTYRNGKKALTEMVSSSDTKLAMPKEILNKGLKKNIYIVIFDHWNQQNIISHKRLTDDVRRVIVSTLESYSTKEVTTAISNYSEILHDERYYFKYKWTLKDFLKRGLDKFMDADAARQNYLKNGDSKEKIKTANKPIRGLTIE